MAPTEYEILPGRSRDNAKEALAKAKENGYDPADVQTFRGGYRIPVWVDEDIETQELEVELTEKLSHDELNAYAQRHDVEVDKSLNKTDKIAAIKSAIEAKDKE